MRPPRAPLPALGVPNAVVWLVAAGVFLTLSAAHNSFPILVSIRAPFLLLAGGITGLALCINSWRPKDATRSRLFRTTALVYAVAIVGIPFAIVRSMAFTRTTDTYLKVLLLMGMVWAVSRSSHGRLAVLRATLLGFMTACVLALRAGVGADRLSGAFVYDANDLALVANMALPLLVWYWMDKRNPMGWIGLAALPIPVLTILRSDSRGGMLAFLAMGLATSAFYSATAPKALRRAFPLVCLAGLLSIPFIPESTLDRFRSIANPEVDYNYTSDEGRLAVWKRGMGYALANPFVGVGLGNFSAAEGRSDVAVAMARQGRGFKWGVAHSIYVEAWAELGLIGGSALVWLLLVTIRDLLRMGRMAGRLGNRDALMLGLIGISLVGYAVGGAFLSWAFYPAPYVLYAIAYASLDEMRGSRNVPAAEPPRARRRMVPLRVYR